MAESVDALVSNTSGATRAGSTPALGTRLKQQSLVSQYLQGIFLFPHHKNGHFWSPFEKATNFEVFKKKKP